MTVNSKDFLKYVKYRTTELNNEGPVCSRYSGLSVIRLNTCKYVCSFVQLKIILHRQQHGRQSVQSVSLLSCDFHFRNQFAPFIYIWNSFFFSEIIQTGCNFYHIYSVSHLSSLSTATDGLTRKEQSDQIENLSEFWLIFILLVLVRIPQTSFYSLAN